MFIWKFNHYQDNETTLNHYGKCPKNSNTKASDKMTYANSVDPDETAPEWAVWSGSTLTAPEGAVWSGSTLFAIPLNI